MRLAVIGAGGRTGRRVVGQGLTRGHVVTALARDPSRLPAGPRVVQGDATDPAAVAAAVEGAEAVIVALGPTPTSPPPVQTEGVRVVLDAMRTAGVPRVVVISGAGADAPGDRKRAVDRLVSALVHRINAADVRSKEDQLVLLEAGGVAWTAVRPPILTDGPPTGAHLTMRSPGPVRLSRADLAALLLDEAATPRFRGQAPFAVPDAQR